MSRPNPIVRQGRPPIVIRQDGHRIAVSVQHAQLLDLSVDEAFRMAGILFAVASDATDVTIDHESAAADQTLLFVAGQFGRLRKRWDDHMIAQARKRLGGGDHVE